MWTTLHHQGRLVKWLAQRTGIKEYRLYQLKRGARLWWLDTEADACARALDVPRDYLFPPGSRVLPKGRRRPSVPRKPLSPPPPSDGPPHPLRGAA